MTAFFSGLFRIFNSNSDKNLKKLLSPDKVAKLEKLIGFKIKNEEYFLQALLHRSFLEQNSEFEVSNERLEFLGDAVLSLTVAEHLFKKFPDSKLKIPVEEIRIMKNREFRFKEIQKYCFIIFY